MNVHLPPDTTRENFEDRLKTVAFIAAHPWCGLAEIRQHVGNGVDLYTDLYVLVRDGKLRRKGTKYHYLYHVAKKRKRSKQQERDFA